MAPPVGKRKRYRAALDEPEDPAVPAVVEGLPCIQCFKRAMDQTWTAIELGREKDAHLLESLPVIKCFFPSLDDEECGNCLVNKSKGCSGLPVMIAGNYMDLIVTMDLVKDVLVKLQGDQPDMVESRRGIVRAVCRLGHFFWSVINRHRFQYGLHYPEAVGWAQRSHYQTLVAIRSVSGAGEDKLLRIGLGDPEHAKFNDACRQFITTFAKYLKKAGVEDDEVQRVVDLVPVKPLGLRKVSVSLSLGGQN